MQEKYGRQIFCHTCLILSVVKCCWQPNMPYRHYLRNQLRKQKQDKAEHASRSSLSPVLFHLRVLVAYYPQRQALGRGLG